MFWNCPGANPLCMFIEAVMPLVKLLLLKFACAIIGGGAPELTGGIICSGIFGGWCEDIYIICSGAPEFIGGIICGGMPEFIGGIICGGIPEFMGDIIC